MVIRADLDGRKILSPPGFDPGPPSPYSVAIPTELPARTSLFSTFVKVLFLCASVPWVPVTTPCCVIEFGMEYKDTICRGRLRLC